MKVRKLRDLTGLSQSKFAAYFKMNVAMVQKWEQGINNVPKHVYYMMCKICFYEDLITSDDYKYLMML